MAEQNDVQFASIAQQDEVLLTVPQAAKFADRHANTIRGWIYKGLLPAQKMGEYGRFKIRKSDLEAALTYKPASESEANTE